ncbi:3-oxoacyl-(acyl-carrier-protein) reductase [Natrialba asiatica DSM 12278]|uniref:3-oxoacyl-(Acyl-carrier-protein) reductase n=1 Tax=Natrialba asiatica (strain ATCC 700177 / DSM 12278 / JCM 9576 / FERM P-10747 / NBRC 102637 / 172P1) TaxID=29540 RepID=M0B669_NATA1|nr:3-oxoacyl-(acyl-carrier-protein) reductase [Natrialba asiatica DSM 12278]
MYEFGGETVIVTGSTTGIGYGIAKAFADTGADVVVNSRTESAVEETAAELSNVGEGSVLGVTADLSRSDEIEQLVDRAVDEFGRVDALVNNAAVWPAEDSMVDASLEEWETTMNVNVRAQYYASKLVAEHMTDRGMRGSIVNLSSQTGDRRTGNRGLYGVSKTAVNGLTWRMAHDLAREGIRMNAVSTDVTDSRQLRHEASQVAAEQPERTTGDVLEEWGRERPLGRLGQPDDIADAVLFLCSNAASYVTGTILRVSGGGNLQ